MAVRDDLSFLAVVTVKDAVFQDGNPCSLAESVRTFGANV